MNRSQVRIFMQICVVCTLPSALAILSGCDNCAGEWRWADSAGAFTAIEDPADSLGDVFMNSGETRGSGAYLSWTFHLPDSLKDLVQAEIREGMIPLQGRVIYEFPKYTDTGSVVTINAAISYEGPLPDSDFYGLILHNHAHVECTLRGQNSPGLWAPLVRQRYFDWHDIGCD